MVKFLDLNKINARYIEQFTRSLQYFLSNDALILGEAVVQFETSFANYCGVDYCIGVSNGLDAIQLIIEAWKELGLVKEGDEVIIPGNTFIATALAVIHAGLHPVSVDVNSETYLIDTQNIQQAITSRTRIIIPVHLYGQACEMNAIYEIAGKYDLLILEDAAQAHGAFYETKRTGNLGNAAAFSFYPSKNLGALGDGGAITTNDIQLENTIRRLRNYGAIKKYNHEVIGFNKRLDSIQALFLFEKLKDLDNDNLRREKIARMYVEGFKKNNNVILPAFKNEVAHVWHLFVIRVKNRDFFQNHMNKCGIETSIHYPIPINKQKALNTYSSIALPVTEAFCSEIVSIPISPVMTDDEVNEVIRVVNTFDPK